VRDPLERVPSNGSTCRGRFVKGQQVAVVGKEKTALPLLILRFGSEGRAVLTCLEMSLRPCSALLSLSPRQELMNIHNHFH